MEKTVTDAIEYRRSIRKFNPKKDLDINIVKKCIINATLAQLVQIFNYGNFIT